MPDISITPKIGTAEVLEYLRKVWGLPDVNVSKVVADKVNHEKLYEDYANICSFLSDRDKVITALKHLDNAIRDKLEEGGLQDLKAKVVAAANRTSTEMYKDPTRDDKPYKTHKVLSGVLDRAESEAGFNGAQTTLARLEKLHTTALAAGDMSAATAFTANEPQWGEYNPDKKAAKDLPGVQLPKSAPTLTGILIKSFNPILLRNGFHWKDPGADAVVHGEFTHRIQWYAIVKAAGGTLTLVNTPVQIFKSMGYLFAGKPNDGTNVYLFELVCDCFEEGNQADNSPGKPHSKTFNCPNVLQSFLSGGIGVHPLPYLNVLMKARYIKRSLEDKGKAETLIRGGQKPVLYGVTSNEDKGELGQGAIWWRKYT